MIRWIAVLATFAFAIELSPGSAPFIDTSGFVFEGRIADPSGRPVTGAEISVAHSSGDFRRHAVSDLDGRYHLPMPFISAGASKGLRIEVSHVLYRPVASVNALRGAAIGSPRLVSWAPEQALAPPVRARPVTRNFVLTPLRGTVSHPMAGPVDPNYAEYCYGRALQLLSQKKEEEAAAFLKIYAQIGGNPRQVARAIGLLSEHYR
jgi:hypothetical protein